jgi:sugar phosphate isomerase/epimerase
MKRREFFQRAAAASWAMSVAGSSGFVSAKVEWEIGCFNRPWTKWSFDHTLAEIKSAGFGTVGLLSRTREEPFIGADATGEYLERLKSRINASGLRANMGALRSRHNVSLEESTAEVRKQIDNAKFLGLTYVLSFGADKPEEFDHYYKVMNDAAGYATAKNVRLVMKPHGGISGSSDEILNVIKKVNHRNFSIWYDAGNIIYYTGKDPVSELEPVARHVTGFCAKDCGAEKGDVMIQFGTGKVNFAEVFRKLKSAGFNGPVMIECCKIGETPDETTTNARANRKFLEKTFSSV